MTQKELIEFQEKTFNNLLSLLKSKNDDYTNNSNQTNDALKNFKLIEHYNVATVEQGLFARMSDKFSRLASFVSSGTLSVKGEAAEDSLKDLIGYSVLFLAYLDEKNKNNKEVQSFIKEANKIIFKDVP